MMAESVEVWPLRITWYAGQETLLEILDSRGDVVTAASLPQSAVVELARGLARLPWGAHVWSAVLGSVAALKNAALQDMMAQPIEDDDAYAQATMVSRIVIGIASGRTQLAAVKRRHEVVSEVMRCDKELCGESGCAFHGSRNARELFAGTLLALATEIAIQLTPEMGPPVVAVGRRQ